MRLRPIVHRSIRAALTLVTLTAPLCVGAAPPEEPMERVTTTGTRDANKLQDLPGNADLISRTILERVGHTHINEAMTRIAGAWISRGDGQEHLTALRSPVLTGAGGCGAFLMAQDGIPLRAIGFCNVNELLEANTEQAERIEVSRGPGLAMQGSNALHGAINVLSPVISGMPARRLGVEAGPWDYYRVLWTGDSGRARVDTFAVTSGNFKENSGYRQQKLTASVLHSGAVSGRTTLALTRLRQDTAGFVVGKDAYKISALRDTNPNPEAYRNVTSARLLSRFERRLADGTRQTATPYLRVTRMEFLQHFLPGQPLEENGHRSIGLMLAHDGAAGALDDVTLGIDFEYTQAYLKEEQAEPTDSPSAFLRATIPLGMHYDYEVSAFMAAAYAHLRKPLFEHTELTAGIRFEHLIYDYDNRMLTGRTRDDGTPCGFGGCRFNRPADRSDRFSNWSPKLGINYYLRRNHQLYLLLAGGYRAPQATELYRLQNDQSVSRIDSEEIASAEIGMRGFTGELNYNVSLFTMKKRNVIFRDSDRINRDNGTTSHEGIELTLGYAFTPKLDLGINATVANHRYRYDQVIGGVNINGNRIDTAPRILGAAHLAWRYSSAGDAELEWVHMGRYYTDPENLNDYPGHDLVNLRVAHDLSSKWTLSLRLTNLTDTEYAERADFGFGEERYFVGAPRALYAALTGTF